MSFANFTPATPQDLAAIDQLIQPPSAPERIHGWMNSQLSLARHCGGCTYQGVRYVINYDEAGHPLVRWDVLESEQKAQRVVSKAAKAARKHAAQEAQGCFL